MILQRYDLQFTQQLEYKPVKGCLRLCGKNRPDLPTRQPGKTANQTANQGRYQKQQNRHVGLEKKIRHPTRQNAVCLQMNDQGINEPDYRNA